MTTFADQKTELNIVPSPQLKSELKHDGSTTPEPKTKPHIPVPDRVEEESKKRGFLSRFSYQIDEGIVYDI